MLNSEDYLPKYIIMLPDKNIIKDVHFGGFGCKVIFKKLLTWSCKAIETVLDIRKADLKSRRAGAILVDYEPMLLWTKMVPRPFIKTDDGFIFAQCNTFNAVLESVVSKAKSATMIKLSLANEKLFSTSQEISLVLGFRKSGGN